MKRKQTTLGLGQSELKQSTLKQSTLQPLKKFTLTKEQQEIVDQPLRAGDLVLVNAFAGTGKTTTCEAVIKAHPQRRILYTVFNKAMQEAALEKLKHDKLQVRTTHSLALAYCKSLAPKASFSAYDLPEECHQLYTLWQGAHVELNDQAYELWDDMQSGRQPYCCHQAYYYVFCRDPTETALWLDAAWDLIIVDEAQDTDVGLAAILQKVTSPILCVGDQFQDIYGFRGTCNALKLLEGPRSKTLYLTESFRFGPEIAELANEILQLSRPKIVGLGKSFAIKGSLRAALKAGPCTLLCRTNAQVFYEASHFKGSIHILGNVFAQIAKLRSYSPRAIRAKLDRALAMGDEQTAAVIKLIIEFDPAAMAEIESRRVAASKAQLILGTVHSAKGLEWDRVVIGEMGDRSLQYIAATRAKKELFY